MALTKNKIAGVVSALLGVFLVLFAAHFFWRAYVSPNADLVVHSLERIPLVSLDFSVTNRGISEIREFEIACGFLDENGMRVESSEEDIEVGIPIRPGETREFRDVTIGFLIRQASVETAICKIDGAGLF